jgi:hypothetical protein
MASNQRNVFMAMLKVAAILAVVLASITGTPAHAQTPVLSYVDGPFFWETEEQLNVSGVVWGLGQHSGTDVVLSVDLAVDVVCRNPAGRVNPAHSRVHHMTLESRTTLLRWGFERFFVTTPALDAGQLCPNPKWSADVQSATITGGRFSVYYEGSIQDDLTIEYPGEAIIYPIGS